MSVKHDCANYNPGDSNCRALIELVCLKKPVCPFYITKEEAERKRKKAEERLDRLYRERDEMRREMASEAMTANKAVREREYQIERRQRLKEEGRCTRCGRPNDRIDKGMTTCSECGQFAKALYERKKLNEKPPAIPCL